jgi:L-alanine-DL-glutamate epimerase-like enolase superfamily enzyme
MKITAIDSYILKIPTKPPISVFAPQHAFVVAELRTDGGIAGLGYTLLWGGAGAETVKTYLDTRLKEPVVGGDPFRIEELWHRMYHLDRGLSRPRGIPLYAMSAIDIGLWDLVGKAAGLPLYRLFGACRDRVPVYGSGGFLAYSVEQLVEEARRYVELGCRHYKMKIGFPDLDANVERVRAVRKAVGERVDLMVDVNQRWDVVTNIRMARKLEALNLFWYEEPVLADNIPQCAEVARNIRIPVATGENEGNRYGFRDLIEQRAASYLMPNLQRIGGFSEGMKVAHLAAAYDLPVTPHLAHELSIHLVGAAANGFLVEYMDWMPDDLLAAPVAVKDGSIEIPETPGHGVEFTPAAIRRYRA